MTSKEEVKVGDLYFSSNLYSGEKLMTVKRITKTMAVFTSWSRGGTCEIKMNLKTCRQVGYGRYGERFRKASDEEVKAYRANRKKENCRNLACLPEVYKKATQEELEVIVRIYTEMIQRGEKA